MNINISSFAALTIAIVTEVAGTTSLQLSEQLTRLFPPWSWALAIWRAFTSSLLP